MTSDGARTVLHVAFPAHGGVAAVVRDLVRDQVQRGWRVVVASPNGPLTRWLDNGVEHVEWNARRSPGPSVWSEARNLSRIVRAVQPQLVHLHSSKAGLAGRLAVRGKVPTVFQPHAWSFLAAGGGVGSAARIWERVGARWCDSIVAVSRGEQEQGVDAGISPPRWEVIANGIDVEANAPRDRADARQRLGLPDAPLVLVAGRICRQKAQDLMVELWPSLTTAVPGAVLALVGRVEDPLPVLPPSVLVRPETDDVRDWYAAADVVAVPSRWEAGLPLVAREAMACGRSVLTSDLDCARESFPAGAGALLPVDDGAAWLSALLDRLSGGVDPDAEGHVGRVHSANEFGVDTMTRRVAEAYDRLLTPAAP
jgi:glycosyltransferase involved in cell wall biosynthesis